MWKRSTFMPFLPLPLLRSCQSLDTSNYPTHQNAIDWHSQTTIEVHHSSVTMRSDILSRVPMTMQCIIHTTLTSLFSGSNAIGGDSDDANFPLPIDANRRDRCNVQGRNHEQWFELIRPDKSFVGNVFWVWRRFWVCTIRPLEMIFDIF